MTPNEKQRLALIELEKSMKEKDAHLARVMSILAEHFSGVVILAHLYDPVTQAAASRALTSGDPFAIRGLVQKFLSEQQLQEQHTFMMRLANMQRPPDENSSGFAQPSN